MFMTITQRILSREIRRSRGICGGFRWEFHRFQETEKWERDLQANILLSQAEWQMCDASRWSLDQLQCDLQAYWSPIKPCWGETTFLLDSGKLFLEERPLGREMSLALMAVFTLSSQTKTFGGNNANLSTLFYWGKTCNRQIITFS